jgi:hypothetical protein
MAFIMMAAAMLSVKNLLSPAEVICDGCLATALTKDKLVNQAIIDSLD